MTIIEKAMAFEIKNKKPQLNSVMIFSLTIQKEGFTDASFLIADPKLHVNH